MKTLRDEVAKSAMLEMMGEHAKDRSAGYMRDVAEAAFAWADAFMKARGPQCYGYRVTDDGIEDLAG